MLAWHRQNGRGFQMLGLEMAREKEQVLEMMLRVYSAARSVAVSSPGYK